VDNSKIIAEEVRAILKSNRCDDTTINIKVNELEQLLGLLDAAFAYLYIIYPNTDEKQKAREAVAALIAFWRKADLNITLKAHVLEWHTCEFNDKWGTGDKEESSIEQGHQIGAKVSSRYARLTNFVKKTESTLNARSQSTHPLVLQQKSETLHATKRKSNESKPTSKGKQREEKKRKRELNISNSKKEELN
jgi:hypothetical protein